MVKTLMSRQDLEIELRKLAEEESAWRSSATQVKVTIEADVPRSMAFGRQESMREGEASSVLPKSGSEVLPSSGRIHPILLPLLERTPSSSGIPIVESPPDHPLAKKICQETREIAEIESGVTSPLPSPLQSPFSAPAVPLPLLVEPKAPVVPEAYASHIRPSTIVRSVLFVYPPLIDEESVITCYRHAAKTVIHETDHITILWATGLEQQHGEAREDFTAKEHLDNYTPGEGKYYKEVKVTADNFNEVRDTAPPLMLQALEDIRERSPFIHRLIEATDLRTRQVLIKLQPHADIRWTLQKELQDFHGKHSHDLIVMPCLPPGMGDDPELEQFLLEHAAVPVALVRSPTPSSRE